MSKIPAKRKVVYVFLAAISVLFGFGTNDTDAQCPGAEIQGPHLSELAADCGVQFGMALASHPLERGGCYREIAEQECAIVTPENAMKWREVQSERYAAYDFREADALVKFARNCGMKVHGHTLIWCGSSPEWLNHGVPEVLKVELRNHIYEMVTHFRTEFPGCVAVWDVVNEAIADDGCGLRRQNNPWAKLGEEFIELAFRAADECCDAKLIYNDYGIETDDPDKDNEKSDYLYRLVRRLLDAGVPIDGIGFQCHLRLEDIDVDYADAIARNLRRFRELGLQLYITELDIRVRQPFREEPPKNDGMQPSSPKRKLADDVVGAQAKAYARIIRTCLEEGVGAVQVWGVTDAYSWITGNHKFEGYGSPLLFDASGNAKPAYDAVRNQFLEWFRPETFTLTRPGSAYAAFEAASGQPPEYVGENAIQISFGGTAIYEFTIPSAELISPAADAGKYRPRIAVQGHASAAVGSEIGVSADNGSKWYKLQVGKAAKSGNEYVVDIPGECVLPPEGESSAAALYHRVRLRMESNLLGGEVEIRRVDCTIPAEHVGDSGVKYVGALLAAQTCTQLAAQFRMLDVFSVDEFAPLDPSVFRRSVAWSAGLGQDLHSIPLSYDSPWSFHKAYRALKGIYAHIGKLNALYGVGQDSLETSALRCYRQKGGPNPGHLADALESLGNEFLKLARLYATKSEAASQQSKITEWISSSCPISVQHYGLGRKRWSLIDHLEGTNSWEHGWALLGATGSTDRYRDLSDVARTLGEMTGRYLQAWGHLLQDQRLVLGRVAIAMDGAMWIVEIEKAPVKDGVRVSRPERLFSARELRDYVRPPPAESGWSYAENFVGWSGRHIAWSGDGRFLSCFAYQGLKPVPHGAVIYDIKKGAYANLDNRLLDPHMRLSAWSPIGARLGSYSPSYSHEETCELKTYDLYQPAQGRIAYDPQKESVWRLPFAWLLDGDTLLLTEANNEYAVVEPLLKVSTNDGDIVRLTPSDSRSSEFCPLPSPDGNLVAFSRTDGLWVWDMRSGKRTQLTKIDTEYTHPAMSPFQDAAPTDYAEAWSQGGCRLHFRGWDDMGHREGIYDFKNERLYLSRGPEYDRVRPADYPRDSHWGIPRIVRTRRTDEEIAVIEWREPICGKWVEIWPEYIDLRDTWFAVSEWTNPCYRRPYTGKRHDIAWLVR